MKNLALISVIIGTVALLISCIEPETNNTSEPAADNYWFQGKAEISSFELKQARYGEIHEGEAVLIFVSEPFSEKSFAKADNKTGEDVGVLKLNFTKNFNTGIYPYSMMTSTFFPFKNGQHAMKISSSSQEWCGHTFMEMKPSDSTFTIDINSYFEGETTTISLAKSILEDDLWSMIRLHPMALPQGEKLAVIPSFFYLRLMHKTTKAYACEAKLSEDENKYVYHINYPELQRNLTISFEKQQPFKIIGWSETYQSGWGASAQTLTTMATRKKTMHVDYWNKNKKQYAPLRKELGLKQ
jgi:hypothetical protein